MRCGADEGGTSLEEELFLSAGCLFIELKCLCEMHFPSTLLSSEDRCLPLSSGRESNFAYSSCGRCLVRRLPCAVTRSLFLHHRDYVSPTVFSSLPIRTDAIDNSLSNSCVGTYAVATLNSSSNLQFLKLRQAPNS
jgi:hypothetical protein